MGRIAAVIFDLDGTLTDPGSGIIATVRGVLATLEAPMPPRAELRWCVGPPLREIFTRLLEPAGKGELTDEAAALYVRNYPQTGASESTVYAGVAQMLEDLHASARLYVVTSKSIAMAERMLGICGIRRNFEAVAGNARLDDKSDTLAELIDREGLERAGTALVGDRAQDIAAGKRVGIFTVGAAYGYGGREELEGAGADRVCESPAEVARVLFTE